jgi:DNA-binding GntR family transcriptional regulator
MKIPSLASDAARTQDLENDYMPLPEIQLQGIYSRSDELYAKLREAIIEGVLQPGERLIEEALATSANISRTPVREALQKLQVEGLVQEASRGVIVAAPTADELADISIVREVLEGTATRLAATSRSELELVTLETILDEQRDATERGDVEMLVALNNSFHETIWQAGRNRYLAHQLAMLQGYIQRLQGSTLALPRRQEETLREHEQMLDAIRRRDAEAAETISREHFRKAEATRLVMRRQALLQKDDPKVHSK